MTATVGPQRPDPGPASTAAQALEGLQVTAAAGLGEVRLAPVVAATLRAALDLVLGGSQGPGVSAVWDDGALDVSCRRPALESLAAAASLLETVDGSLGPGPDQSSWVLRVPVLGPRSLYLLLRQGELGVALPWHAVLRMRIASRAALEGMARNEGVRLLPPWVRTASENEECPAVLVALGLRRAYVMADRLVWRMPAEQVEAPAPDQALTSLGRSVRTDEGELYWAADPVMLLANVEPLPLPRGGAPAGRHVDERTPARPRPTDRKAQAPSKTGPARPGGAGTTLRLVELGREDVEPLPRRSPEETAATPEPEAPSMAPTSPAPIPRAPTAPRALLAEDSIVGRIFLQRLLESRGFAVVSAASARELGHLLGRGPWAVVFADVELPDSARGEHLRARDAAPGAEWVALVRDADDEALARAMGVDRSLRKPFELESLAELLRLLALEEPR